MNRKQEARAILAINPEQRLYESAIPCKKCNSTTMRIEIAKNRLNGVVCYYCRNKLVRDYHRKVYATEEGRIKNSSAVLAWHKENPGKSCAKYAKRRAAKIQRTPAWADLKAINDFYANRPDGYHVDHIIPLKGKLVSGLHVLENLQYLPASENCSKGNKFDPSI